MYPSKIKTSFVINRANNLKPSIIFVAGFGDNSSMYEPLLNTQLADLYQLELLNFPGFGELKNTTETTSLNSIAQYVTDVAVNSNAKIIVAHSVSSIIASISAINIASPLQTVISLEGNLTTADAYFSGTAANFKSPEKFIASFCERLKEMSVNNPIIERYREQVLKCNQKAMWELGCDAKKFSNQNHAGELLSLVDNVLYIYNPHNCDKNSLEWLHSSLIEHEVLKNASHWPSIDKPDELSKKIINFLKRF